MITFFEVKWNFLFLYLKYNVDKQEKCNIVSSKFNPLATELKKSYSAYIFILVHLNYSVNFTLESIFVKLSTSIATTEGHLEVT